MAFIKLLHISLETLAIYCLARVFYWFIRSLYSPLRNLPGPPSSSFIFGNVNDVRRPGTALDEWYQTYGKVMKFKGFFGKDLLCTLDTRALNHVLMHSFDYQKTSEGRFLLSRLLGNGILVTESEKHRQQRRIMNPSFSNSSIRDLTPVFFEKALQLRDLWETELISMNESKDGSKKFDVLSWLSRVTLDIIGLAGFHHQFNALSAHQDSNSLSNAVGTLLRNSEGISFLTLLQASFPVFRVIPDKRDIETRKARNTMLQLGEELLDSRREGGALEKGRDLLSVLVRANMDAGLSESHRMNNEDVLAQVPTFLVAGHETTSNQIAWALYALAKRPDLQARLREEVRSVLTDAPSADELNAEHLPFLEMVVRETLRLYGAVSSIVRTATKDDVIPVEEPYVDRKGRMCTEIHIKKGESVVVPILALNRVRHIWGEDAEEFTPDRWANTPAAAKGIPGIWADLLTFSGGPRSCIGFRFALIEIKVILFTLIRRFEFSLAVSAEDIEVRSVGLTRPSVRGEKGAQMPLMVKVCED